MWVCFMLLMTMRKRQRWHRIVNIAYARDGIYKEITLDIPRKQRSFDYIKILNINYYNFKQGRKHTMKNGLYLAFYYYVLQ